MSNRPENPEVLGQASEVLLECAGCGDQTRLAHFYIDGFYHVFEVQGFPQWIHRHAHCSRAFPDQWTDRHGLNMHLCLNHGFRQMPFRVVVAPPRAHLEKKTMTRSEVETAIEHVLGEKVANALRVVGKVGLPERLRMAALRIFSEDWPSDAHVKRVREALKMLDREGQFNFDPE